MQKPESPSLTPSNRLDVHIMYISSEQEAARGPSECGALTVLIIVWA